MTIYDYKTSDIQAKLANMELADLVILCYDQFPEVYRQFKADEPLTQKVQTLVQYCQQKQSWPKLLTRLKVKPELYQQINPKKLRELIDLLLECNMMSNDNSRDIVVADLPPEIRTSIIRNDAAKLDVRNILDTCLKHTNGLTELLDVIRYYDGNTLTMQRIDEFLR